MNDIMQKEDSRTPETDAELAELFKEINRSRAEFEKAKPEVPAAIAQLKRSERGRQALRDFKVLLANGGSGLDSRNWNALATLCRAEGYVGPTGDE
jgi:hypothetical protein